MHFCYLIFYMYLCGYGLIMDISYVGLVLQDKIIGYSLNTNGYAVTVFTLFLIFYPGAIYISFLAYREFKGMLFDSGMGAGGMRMMMPLNGMGGQPQPQPQQQQPQQQPQQQQRSQYQRLNESVDSNDNRSNSYLAGNDGRSNSYRAFSGQGTRVGQS
mmetsp:Transcript_43111/g.31494  ORF Transcript_43111/g.31494 Transcript_43111/m.31494 type:complete len:158 (+) Transcript_43111:194-667(+)